MTSKKKKRREPKQQNARRRQPTRGRQAERERPTPVEAIELRHAEFAERFAARGDRFSQLLSKALTDERSGDELVSRSGLSEDEHGELNALAEAAHASFQREMSEATATLRALLAPGDPLYTLSIIQASNVMGVRGSYYEPTHHGMENKVELVAGLMLTQPPATPPNEVSDAQMHEIHSELERLTDLLTLRNLSAPKGEDPVIAELRFMGRLHWMTIRGTSYAHHGTDLARSLYRPFDHWFLDRYGFTIDDLLAVGAGVEALINDRVNGLRAEAQAFADQVLAHARSPAARARLTPERSAERDAPGGMLALMSRAVIYIFQLGVRSATSFTVDDLVDAGLPQDRVEAVLKELSLSAGSLSPSDYSGLFDKSPLVERPFFEFDGRFLLAIPGMVLRDAVAVLEDRFMTGAPGFSVARAKTLDALAVEYLTGLLPASRGFTNLFYKDTELDGLVIFESRALVVEGKGTALSVQAQRGDVVRLGRDLARAVEEAWEQGARAREYLLGDQDAVFGDASGNEVLRLPAGAVDEVFIVNPTLHELAGHASQLPRLRSLGLFPAGEFPWSVFINDLRVIAETCENAAVFLHYLAWRGRLPLGDRVTVMDELDLWGSYLLCERFGSLADGGHYVVGNSITDFDAYYAGVVGDGPQHPKPRKFLEEPVKSFVDRMACLRPAGWLEAAGACLDLSLPELAYVCAGARQTWRQANATGSAIVSDVGRVRLVGLPRGAALPEVMSETEQVEGEATFHVYVQGSKERRGQIAWAKCVKPVTFELSDFERAARHS